MSEAQNMIVVQEFTRIFKNEHKVDGLDHLFHKDFRHNFRSGLPAGVEGMRQLGLMLNGAFPDAAFTEEDLIASGDKVVERGATTATHKGAMMGERPTDKTIRWSEINIYEFKDGKIVEHWVEMEMWQLLEQIGILPVLGG
jgi:predicted ester cyclase